MNAFVKSVRTREIPSKMIDVALETLCEDVRNTPEHPELPVSPKAIAQAEGIILDPGDHGNGFDGRIEFLSSKNVHQTRRHSTDSWIGSGRTGSQVYLCSLHHAERH